MFKNNINSDILYRQTRQVQKMQACDDFKNGMLVDARGSKCDQNTAKLPIELSLKA